MTYIIFKERVQRAYSPNITITDDNVMTAYSALPNNKRKRLGLTVGRRTLNYRNYYRKIQADIFNFIKECTTKILLATFKDSARKQFSKYVGTNFIEND